MAKNLILAIDQGTTGTTVMLVDNKLKVVAMKNVEFRQHYPKPGWVEHDLNDIWSSTLKAMRSVIGGKKNLVKNIAAIGITNQRETSCFWSKKTGKPVRKAIVWQDRRTAGYCEELKKAGKESVVQLRTGLLLDPYFSATKVNWVIENDNAVKKSIAENDLAFGTIDSFLLFKLTNGLVHATEPSNASRTMLFNIEKCGWDEELLGLFKIPKQILPDVLDSNAEFGVTRKIPGLPDGIPIHGILGDQQAALLGQACIDEGQAKCTYGTGSFILMNTGSNIPKSKHRLLGTVAWKMNGKTTYALEGGAFTAGASVQWLRDGLQFFNKSSDVESLAKKVKTSDGVVFVPAFAGIGAPYWNANARASFFGITRGTTKAHIARAVLDGVALMNVDILKSMEQDLGRRLVSLNVDGGMSANDLLMQLQSDLLDTKLVRPKVVETTAMGAVFAAGLGIGLWRDLNDIRKSWKKDKEFNSKMSDMTRNEIVTNWHLCVKKA